MNFLPTNHALAILKFFVDFESRPHRLVARTENLKSRYYGLCIERKICEAKDEIVVVSMVSQQLLSGQKRLLAGRGLDPLKLVFLCDFDGWRSIRR